MASYKLAGDLDDVLNLFNVVLKLKTFKDNARRTWGDVSENNGQLYNILLCSILVTSTLPPP